jgi:hypothetical protein
MVTGFDILGNAPKPIRCDCDYVEGVFAEDEDGPGIDDEMCECGHTRDQHENRADACTQPADPQPMTTAPNGGEA